MAKTVNFENAYKQKLNYEISTPLTPQTKMRP